MDTSSLAWRSRRNVLIITCLWNDITQLERIHPRYVRRANHLPRICHVAIDRTTWRYHDAETNDRAPGGAPLRSSAAATPSQTSTFVSKFLPHVRDYFVTVPRLKKRHFRGFRSNNWPCSMLIKRISREPGFSWLSTHRVYFIFLPRARAAEGTSGISGIHSWTVDFCLDSSMKSKTIAFRRYFMRSGVILERIFLAICSVVLRSIYAIRLINMGGIFVIFDTKYNTGKNE